MGLPSLKQKIADKLVQGSLSEADVVYLLIEMVKYIERSDANKDHLRNPEDLALDASFPSLYFFRNWAAHTEKDRGKHPTAYWNA